MKHLIKGLLMSLVTISLISILNACNNNDTNKNNTNSIESSKAEYSCPMHPSVHSDHPGLCPICNMKLEKVKRSVPSNDSGSIENEKMRKIKFYRNPMDPTIHSDKPMKDSMGMDYVPVYEEQNKNDEQTSTTENLNRGSISLSTEQLKLSGTSVVSAEMKTLTAEIRVPGRALGGNRVSFQVYEQDLSWVKSGMKFSAETPSFPGERLTGKISSVDSILDPMTRTVRADGMISSTGKISLRSEATLVGKLEIEIPKAISIPESAIIHTGNRNLVYVSNKNGGFSPRLVVLGLKAQGRYEIKSGLTEGEKVSSGPNFLLDSESRIQATYD